MESNDCHNFHDFRRLAQRRLPGPIFNYIDGAADDEVTYRRNTAGFEQCDLVPNVLRGVESVDLSVTVHRRSTQSFCRGTLKLKHRTLLTRRKFLGNRRAMLRRRAAARCRRWRAAKASLMAARNAFLSGRHF